VILGIIPARGGSKGILKKNIKEMCGKPLIAWSIEAARQSKLLDRFIVSTEDVGIAQIANGLGAEVLVRPVELATDEASTLSVLQHVLEHMPAEIIVLLQPTSPIRNKGLIDRCIKRFQDTNADSLATGFICKNYEWGTYSKRRQELRGFFYDDGNVYVFKAELIRRGDRYGKRMERVVTEKEENIEIDDEFDFWLAEQILKKREGSVNN
jgi:N-acylneuraminate cytidylyltransferase